MSRSSTEALAIGIGTCDVAIGAPRRARLKPAAFARAANAIRGAVEGRAAASASARDAIEPGVPGEADAEEAMPSAPAHTSVDDTPAAPAARHGVVEIEPARCYTEEGAVEALGRALAEAHGLADSPIGAQASRRATIVLDDFWGRHAIMRGDFRSLRARDLDEVAAAYFADTFGVDSDTLAIRWQVQPGGRTLFASALPRALIERIHEASAAARVDVASLMLALPQRLNRLRAAIKARSGWLLVVTDSLLHAVAIGNGAWSAYDAERLFHNGFDAGAVADAARQIFERSAAPCEAECEVYLCGLALDPAPFEQSFAHLRALPEHMSSAPPALRLMELAS